MASYQKHFVKCRCVLPQLKSKSDPPLHQFMVFSTLNNEGHVNTKLVQCDNCGIVHKIIDLCKTEILNGREDISSLVKIDDLKKSLPQNITAVLDSHDAPLPLWEQAQFIIDNCEWGQIIPLSVDIIDGMRQGKYLKILGVTLHKVESYTIEEYVTK